MDFVKTGVRINKIAAANNLFSVGVVLVFEARSYKGHEVSTVGNRCRLDASELCISRIEHAYTVKERAQCAAVVREVQ